MMDFATLRRFRLLARRELAPFPGRTGALWRTLLTSAIIIVTSMTLQVPSLAVSLIMVFFTSQENTAITRKAGVGLFLGVTLAVMAVLLLLMLTFSHPSLRLLGASVLVFVGMYFLRVSRLGSLGYLMALLVVSLQGAVDKIDNPEMMTRVVLWSWVSWCYPVVVTLLVNRWFLSPQPAALLRKELDQRLRDVDAQLAAHLAGQSATAITLDAVERAVLTSHRHLAFAGAALAPDTKSRLLMRVATVDRLHAAAARLSRVQPAALTAAQQDRLTELRAAIAALRADGGDGDAARLSPALPVNPDQRADLHLQAACEVDLALTEMAHALNAWSQSALPPPVAAPAAMGALLAPDAWTNPAYAQFALKATLAAMLCYGLYTAVQWPGIQTASLSAIIIALPTLGASAQKGVLRLLGCAFGCLVALAAEVFIVPHLDSITGLLMLALPVIAVGAWISTGSPRSSYMGLQFIFTFAVMLLGSFHPDTDLSAIRDRMIGILLGVGITLTTFTLLWPEREGAQFQQQLAGWLRSIARLARLSPSAVRASPELERARLGSWALLARNRDTQARVALEPGWLQDEPDQGVIDMQTWFAQAQEALFAVHWLQTVLQHAGATLSASFAAELERVSNQAAHDLEQLAAHFDGASQPLPAGWDSGLAAFERVAHDAAPGDSIGTEISAAVRAVFERIQQLGKHMAQLSHQPASTQ